MSLQRWPAPSSGQRPISFPSSPLPRFPASSDSRPQGLVRIVNLSDEPGTPDIIVIDAAGVRVKGASLAVAAGGTARFESDDLESGNPDAGLTGATGPLAFGA